MADTDNGVLDADPVHDRAVGPAQFLPSTWRSSGVDADGDGRADPQDIDDAFAAMALYLCRAAGGGSLLDEASQRLALWSYNRSTAYADRVLAVAAAYAAAWTTAGPATDGLVLDVAVSPGAVPPLETVRGITVHRDLAPHLARLLTDAEAAGIVLGGWGWRSYQQQVQLRTAHCGSSFYDVYLKPASECDPPTARPGESMHEQGLAVDFTQGGRTLTTTSSGYRWLVQNAAAYGLYNLPSEPWHWSTNGR
jgi:hypothetical protein